MPQMLSKTQKTKIFIALKLLINHNYIKEQKFHHHIKHIKKTVCQNDMQQQQQNCFCFLQYLIVWHCWICCFVRWQKWIVLKIVVTWHSAVVFCVFLLLHFEFVSGLTANCQTNDGRHYISKKLSFPMNLWRLWRSWLDGQKVTFFVWRHKTTLP